jgi:hypothetical protein
VSFLISESRFDLLITFPFELTPRKSSARYAWATDESWFITDASHLSSISRIVASGVDFFSGITAAGDELGLGVALGLLLVAAGDEDLLGEGEVPDLGAGEVFSVVTETLGSEAVASGEAAGDGLSSWARASGVAAVKRAVMATSMIFI